MEITFDAEQVEITPCSDKYFKIEAETSYPNEVLDNFTSEDIIEYYGDLSELHKKLTEHFYDG